MKKGEKDLTILNKKTSKVVTQIHAANLCHSTAKSLKLQPSTVKGKTNYLPI